MRTFKHKATTRLQPVLFCMAGVFLLILILIALFSAHTKSVYFASYIGLGPRILLFAVVPAISIIYAVQLIIHGIRASWFFMYTYELVGNRLTAYDPVLTTTKSIELTEVSAVWSFRTFGPPKWSRAIDGQLIVAGPTSIPISEELELWEIVREKCKSADFSPAPREWIRKYSVSVK